MNTHLKSGQRKKKTEKSRTGDGETEKAKDQRLLERRKVQLSCLWPHREATIQQMCTCVLRLGVASLISRRAVV